MKNKTKGLLFKLPAIILLIAVVIGSFYVKIANIMPIRWSTPITILIIFILYLVGEYFSMKDSHLF